jgi:copper chaperone
MKMTTTIKVKGMSCNHCVMTVTKAVGRVDGVKGVQIDLASGEVGIEHETKLQMSKIKEEIEKAGYELG